MKPSYLHSGQYYKAAIIYPSGRKETLEGPPCCTRADALKQARWAIAEIQARTN